MRAPGQAPRAWRGARAGCPGVAGATCGPRFVLCHCARLGWGRGGAGPGSSQARVGARGCGARARRLRFAFRRGASTLGSPHMAALFSPQVLTGWGSLASGASRMYWDWRRSLWGSVPAPACALLLLFPAHGAGRARGPGCAGSALCALP